MIIRPISRIFLLLALAATLGSCSYSYDVKAVVRNGAVAFIFDGGSRGAPRVDTLIVECVSAKSRRIWEIRAIGPNGPEVPEIKYGELPTGMGDIIVPSALAIGQLYRVTVLASDGHGGGNFVISDNREILNFDG